MGDEVLEARRPLLCAQLCPEIKSVLKIKLLHEEHIATTVKLRYGSFHLVLCWVHAFFLLKIQLHVCLQANDNSIISSPTALSLKQSQQTAAGETVVKMLAKQAV